MKLISIMTSHTDTYFYPAISTFAVQIYHTNNFLLYSWPTNKLLKPTNKLLNLRINF